MSGVDAGRIRWRCRRGVKELDILMERFVTKRLPELPPDLLVEFVRLLDEPDPDLLAWITGRAPPASDAYLPLIAMLRELHASEHQGAMVTPDKGSFAALPDLMWASVRGADATAFLHGQFCADLMSVSNGEMRLTAWCTPQGRVITTLFTGHVSGEWTLVLPANMAADTLQRLRRFVLRSRVELTAAPMDAVVIGCDSPVGEALRAAKAMPLFAMPGRTHHGSRFLACLSGPVWSNARASLPATARETTPAGWLRDCVRMSLPWVDAGTTDSFLPQELDLERWNGLSFSKGCFPGQEIIARLHYRGAVKRGLFRMRAPPEAADTLQSGTRLMDESGKPAGTVLYAGSVEADGMPVLAVVDFAKPAHAVLRMAGGTPVTVTGGAASPA
jgi:hypothetical protein